MVTILETLADYAPSAHDPDILTEYVRQALGRAISRKFINDNKSNVITIDPKLEQIIMESVQRTENGSYITIEPEVTNTILSSLSKQVQRLVEIRSTANSFSIACCEALFQKMTERF